MCLTLSSILRDTSDLGNDDAILDGPEVSDLIGTCVGELSSHFGRYVGYKITIVDGFIGKDGQPSTLEVLARVPCQFQLTKVTPTTYPASCSGPLWANQALRASS